MNTYVAEDWSSDGRAWPALFRAIDGRDAQAFAEFLAPGGEFRFGNMDAVHGRAAVVAAVSGFFAAIGGCRHRLLRTWSTGTSAACEGEVTYTRLDGRIVILPFTNTFTLEGGLVSAYRIYIDNAPLWAP